MTALHVEPFGASWWPSAVVGAAFVWAGMGKVLDLASWRRGSAALGAPWAVASMVPWWEIGLGASLVSGWFAAPVRIAGVATLVAFSGLLAANLARGSRPPCACFGGRRDRPLSWMALARNAALVGALVAALLLT